MFAIFEPSPIKKVAVTLVAFTVFALSTFDVSMLVAVTLFASILPTTVNEVREPTLVILGCDASLTVSDTLAVFASPEYVA